MATLGALLAAAPVRPKQPWEEGEGIGQPTQRIDPEALAAVIGQIQASAPPNQTVPDEAMMQADMLRKRQETAAMAGAASANALQAAPLGGMTIRSLLSGLLASAGVR